MSRALSLMNKQNALPDGYSHSKKSQMMMSVIVSNLLDDDESDSDVLDNDNNAYTVTV